MIIVDENVDQVLIDRLKEYDFELISIREEFEGINDKQVIQIAKENNGLVITEDKDFGELIFSYNIRGCSVLLLRYKKSDYEQIEGNVFKALQYYETRQGHFFITITAKKIRVRKI